MQLFFIRHGETIYNTKRCYYGLLDPKLTAKGEREIKERAKELEQVQPTAIYTSALKRTNQTASIICAERQWPTSLIEPVPALNEMDFGEWEGKTADEVEAHDPEPWQQFMTSPFSLHPTGGEAFIDFKARVLKSFKQIISNHQKDDTVIFVGHLGALRIILHTYFESDKDFFDGKMSNQEIKSYTLGG